MNAPATPAVTSTLAHMRSVPRWLLHTASKQPIYADGSPRRGVLDVPADLARLVTYEQAVAALARVQTVRPDVVGIGFALGPDGTGGGWQGIDLDHLSDRPDLQGIAHILPGYVETSIGGDGLHAIGYGTAFPNASNNGVEAYSGGRYFTYSGKALRDGALTDLSGFVASSLSPWLGGRTAACALKAAPEWAGCLPVQDHVIDDLRSALGHLKPLAADYHTWIALGEALADPNLCGEGKALWFEWSAADPRFDPEEAERKWATFKPGRTGYAAVFAKAQNLGWQNPRAGARDAGDAVQWREVPVSQGFRFIHVRDMLSAPQPVEWLIEEGTLCQLFGASKAGKSFLALDWSACIATGRDWGGREVAQGPVFYLAGEGHRGIARRLRAWELSHDQSLKDAPLHVSNMPAALIDAGNAALVASHIEAMEADYGAPKLIVIDTLARNFGNGEESSNADIGRFIGNLDALLKSRFDASILIVHHTGHGEQERARGASALHAAMDHEFRLEVKGDIRQLVTTKNKEGEIPQPLAFELKQVELDWLDRHGFPMSSAVLVPVAASPFVSRPVLGGAKRIAFEALRQALEEEGRPPSSEVLAVADCFLVPTATVHEDAWRRRAYAAPISSGGMDAKRKAFNRQLDSLRSDGYIGGHEGEWWVIP